MPYPGRRKPPLPTPPNGFKSGPPTSGYVRSSVEPRFRGCVVVFGLEGLAGVAIVVADELFEKCLHDVMSFALRNALSYLLLSSSYPGLFNPGINLCKIFNL